MSFARRFLTGFRETETSQPGLELNEDGTVDLVNPDGSRTTLGGSGGFVPSDNWCELTLNNGSIDLTAASPSYILAAGDLNIEAQAGSDFAIGLENGLAAILSAQGGWFQASFFFGPPGGVTLDGGSTNQRLLEFFLTTGQFNPPPPRSFGIDAQVAVVAAPNPDMSVTVMATPGFAPPGRAAVWGIGLEFGYATGTDEIIDPFGNSGRLVIWQVA
jgi:hypothetical protein